MATHQTTLYFVTYKIPPDATAHTVRMTVPADTLYRDVVKAAERVAAAVAGSSAAVLLGTVQEGSNKDAIWYDDAP